MPQPRRFSPLASWWFRCVPAFLFLLIGAVVQAGPAQATATKRVASKDGGVSFEIPAQWSAAPKKDALLYAMGVGPNGLASLTLAKKRPAAAPSAQALAKEVKAGFGLKGTVVASGQLAGARDPMHWVSVRDASSAAKSWRITVFAFVRNQDVYWLSGACDERDFAQLEPIFRAAATSMVVP